MYYEPGEFVRNMATYALREAVNKSAEELPHGVGEFAHAGLEGSPDKALQATR